MKSGASQAVDVEDIGHAAGGDIGLEFGRVVGRNWLVVELDIGIGGAEVIEDLLEELVSRRRTRSSR